MSVTPSRLYPDRPFLAVSIAVFRSGRVLLIARAKPPFPDAFTLPGGLVELGETLEEACLRELLEETGVRAKIVAFNAHAAVIEHDEERRVKRHFLIASFAGEWISGEGETGEEAAAIVWASPDEVSGLNLTPGLAPIIAGARVLAEEHP